MRRCINLGLIWFDRIRLAVPPNAKMYGAGKNLHLPTVLSRFWTNVFQIWEACRRVPLDWRVSFRLLISCSVAEICSVKIQSFSPKSGFLPPPRGSSDQIFQIAVTSKYVFKFGWDPFSDLRDKASKKKKKERKKKNHSGKLEGCIVLNGRNTVFARSGSLYATGVSLGPLESSTQTASRWLQPFLQGSLDRLTHRQTTLLGR